MTGTSFFTKRPLVFNPARETLIRASDTLIIIGADTQLKRLEALAHVPG